MTRNVAEGRNPAVIPLDRGGENMNPKKCIRDNLYRYALSAYDPPRDFPWHRDAHSPKSSQAFCFSAFGTLKGTEWGNHVIHGLLVSRFPEVQTDSRQPHQWDIRLEAQNEVLLGELGPSQPTSIDALLSSSREIICIESKFVRDALQRLGGCSQVNTRNGSAPCLGFYGPGSDIKTHTDAWCRLTTQDRQRSPRLYWLLGRQFFQPQVFERQESSGVCPLRDGSYQLMRNFLFAAMLAQQEGKPLFGVMVICPDCTSRLVREQVAGFKTSILLPEHSERVQFVAYEDYTRILRDCGGDAVGLADFLDERIKTVAASR
jgi:hypothetical protein